MGDCWKHAEDSPEGIYRCSYCLISRPLDDDGPAWYYLDGKGLWACPDCWSGDECPGCKED